MPVIGFLSGGSSGALAHLVAAFPQGLEETGFAEGQNVSIEYRWANGDYDRLPGLAADLVRLRAAESSRPARTAALAAKAATATIPVVFVVAIDPITGGLVASLNRPGGNVTGMTFMARLLAAKRLELLHELVPGVAAIAVLVNPDNPTVAADIKQVEEGAHSLGVRVDVVNASTDERAGERVRGARPQRSGPLFVSGDPLFFSRRDQLVRWPLAMRLPRPTLGASSPRQAA